MLLGERLPVLAWNLSDVLIQLRVSIDLDFFFIQIGMSCSGKGLKSKASNLSEGEAQLQFELIKETCIILKR